jgi:LPXTG-motif cell wall-anchored protein
LFYKVVDGAKVYLQTDDSWGGKSTADLFPSVTGKVSINKATQLDVGTYYFTEIKAPDGYILDGSTDEIEVQVGKDKTTVNGEDVTIGAKIYNRVKPPVKHTLPDTFASVFSFYKYGANGKTNKVIGKLQGAEFVLYRIVGTKREYFVSNQVWGTQSKAKKFVSDKNGLVTTGLNQFEAGTYYFTETKAPKTYLIDKKNDPIKVVVAGNASADVTIKGIAVSKKPIVYNFKEVVGHEQLPPTLGDIEEKGTKPNSPITRFLPDTGEEVQKMVLIVGVIIVAFVLFMGGKKVNSEEVD